MNGTLREGSRSSKCIVSALNELAAPSQVLNYFKETAAYRWESVINECLLGFVPKTITSIESCIKNTVKALEFMLSVFQKYWVNIARLFLNDVYFF